MQLAFFPLFLSFRWQDVLDIVLVALLCYQLYRLVRGTAALNIFIGIAIFYAIFRLVRLLDLELFSSILGKFIDVGVIALLIVFQQELRRFFLFIGTSNVLRQPQWRKALFSWRKPSMQIVSILKSVGNTANVN
jgi:DNA integrity scanning protein DisA with diadenylate cyclase activity